MIVGIVIGFIIGFIVGRGSGVQDGIAKVRKALDDEGIDLSDYGF